MVVAAFGIQTANLISLVQPPTLRASPFLRKGGRCSISLITSHQSLISLHSLHVDHQD